MGKITARTTTAAKTKADSLDWIETAAIENMKGKHATAEILSKEASATLTVLLAGIGGSLTYGGVKVIETGAKSIAAWGLIAVCVWLLLLAWWLVRACMQLEPIDAVYNEPENLLKHAGDSFEAQREKELRRIQCRIKNSWERNERLAQSLNSVRRAAVLTPVIFVVAVAIAATVAVMQPKKAETKGPAPSASAASR